jgi:hypothetical protein
VLYPRCAGLDVHKDTIVACVRCVSALEHHEVRSFDTTTTGPLVLVDWQATHESLMWRWKAPAFTGRRRGTCSRAVST